MNQASTRITLGEIYRTLRSELGQGSPTRLGVSFDQHTTMVPRVAQTGSISSRRSLRGEVDYERGELVRIDMRSAGMAGTVELRISIRRQGSEYVYSPDGLTYGRFSGVPSVLSIEEFETLLHEIPVQNVAMQQVRDHKEGVTLDAFDVELDVNGFVALVQIFGDTITASENARLESFTVHITAAGDVVLDYWWKTVGEESSPDSSDEAYDCSSACHVTVRLLTIAAVTTANVPIDDALPVFSSVDEVWGAARTEASPAQV